MARVSIIDPQQAPPFIREAFEKMEAQNQRIINLFRVASHSQHIARNFLRLGSAIKRDEDFSPKLREIAILRVGYLCGSFYEYTKHVVLGKQKGLTQQQIDEIPYWVSSKIFDKQERAVLAYTDEVTRVVQVRDETFAELKNYFSEEQIVKLTATIGYYGMVCRMLVPLQIDLDPGENSLLPGINKY